LLDVLNAGRSNQRPRIYNLHPGDAEHPTKGVNSSMRSANVRMVSGPRNEANMTMQSTRREILRRGLAVAGLSVLDIPEWVLPALAQDEAIVPFTDLPDNIVLAPAPDRRIIDIRKINGPFTPAAEFATTQHYGHPEIDPAAFRLKLSGLIVRPKSFSLDELRRLGTADLVAGFECSGNRRPLQGLCGNGRWTGIPLRKVLDQAGVKPEAREFVFFGADHGEEEVEFRTQKFKVDQQFGRSLPREKALSPDPFLVWALNGEPLTRHQGSPLRLIVPGWYGVANVKWLAQIHAQDEAFLGKYQARWYRTLRGETIDGEVKWKETAVTRMQLKSFIARVTRDGSACKVFGVVLNDGTPLKSVEVRVDGGAWQPATLDPATSGKYSWKLFTYKWAGATPGEHTLVSRVTDVTGTVQPTEQELENKKTFLEDNSQFPRKVMIS
jgi:DMSO/TMAO reductase YedYZ molybdopterin-dependent catalytic subunit